MKFVPSHAEPDIWMRDMGDHYEYIAMYVDDLTIASRNPQAIIDVLEAKPINFSLRELEKLMSYLVAITSVTAMAAFAIPPRTI